MSVSRRPDRVWCQDRRPRLPDAVPQVTRARDFRPDGDEPL